MARNVVTLYRDEDVLDTWFSSALWPFSTLGWPDQTPELKRYYKTDVLSTAHDIIFFWVARMMMMGLHFMQEVPFHTVYIHALVRDEKGQKMSKTKGNVVDPLELIDAYGADALRFTMAALAAQGRDIKIATSRVEGYRNFGTKLWNAARFCEMNECVRVEGFDPTALTQTVNKWIAGEAARAAAEITEALETYRFNDAAGAAYRFVWNVFCDWYLEFAKPLLMGSDEAAKAETRATAAWVLDQILLMLHPFMPFITEELWQRTAEQGPKRETMLVKAAWPNLSGLGDAAADAEMNWVIRFISEVRSVRAEMNVPAGAKLALLIKDASAESGAARSSPRPDPASRAPRKHGGRKCDPGRRAATGARRGDADPAAQGRHRRRRRNRAIEKGSRQASGRGEEDRRQTRQRQVPRRRARTGRRGTARAQIRCRGRDGEIRRCVEAA